jgi:hypothetical protein
VATVLVLCAGGVVYTVVGAVTDGPVVVAASLLDIVGQMLNLALFRRRRNLEADVGIGTCFRRKPANRRHPETETDDLGQKGTGRVRVVADCWALLGWPPIPQRKGGPLVP